MRNRLFGGGKDPASAENDAPWEGANASAAGGVAPDGAKEAAKAPAGQTKEKEKVEKGKGGKRGSANDGGGYGTSWSKQLRVKGLSLYFCDIAAAPAPTAEAASQQDRQTAAAAEQHCCGGGASMHGGGGQAARAPLVLDPLALTIDLACFGGASDATAGGGSGGGSGGFFRRSTRGGQPKGGAGAKDNSHSTASSSS